MLTDMVNIGYNFCFKQTWASYLCCQQAEDIGVEPDLLNYIGKVIVHLLGDEAMNLYSGTL
jgi:hypothetical protein